MLKILLVGAGQIGSRHLQAISRLDIPALVYVVDPGVASLERAKQRFEESLAGKSTALTLRYETSLEAIAEAEIDFLLIATSADVRLEILKKVLPRFRPKNALLEKVVFQSNADFDEAIALARDFDTRIWVNCPRRVWSKYQQLKTWLKTVPKASALTLRVRGRNWGMASNSVHFLDLFAYLSGAPAHLIDTSRLNDVLAKSKREGFFEIFGTLQGVGSLGRIILQCEENSEPPALEVFLEGDFGSIKIDESKGILQSEILTPSLWNPALEERFSVPMQSEITHLVIQDILSRKTCGLATLEESYQIHRPLLKALLPFFRRKLETPDLKACFLS